MEPLTQEDIQKDLEFDVGQRYIREDLHKVCGGNHQPGISPVTDLSAIFLFGSTSEMKYGYKDEWLPNDHFLLTGVGQEGDQSWEGYNESLATHKQDNRRVFLFEKVPDESPTVVTYVGEFEYVNHREDTLPDKNGDLREAYRFELRPVDGEYVESSIDLEDKNTEQLYELAKEASPDNTPKSIDTARSGDYNRSDVVREFALRDADGICQGCLEPAPFEDENGRPYLEVHHLHRLSDNGLDDPDNVIALCPNCHARVHHGSDGDAFNEELISQANSRTYSLS